MFAEVADFAADDVRAVASVAGCVGCVEDDVAFFPFAICVVSFGGAAVVTVFVDVFFLVGLEDCAAVVVPAGAAFFVAAVVPAVFFVTTLFVAGMVFFVATVFFPGAVFADTDLATGTAVVGEGTAFFDDFIPPFLFFPSVAVPAFFFDALAGFDAVFALVPPLLEVADDAERGVEADFADGLVVEVVRVRS